MACTTARLNLIIGIVGVYTIVVGVLLGWVIVPVIVRSKIAEILALKPGTESWDRWVDLPVPIQFRVFVFNVENPEEIVRGEMPKVTEVGPYVYKEKRIKNVRSVDLARGTVEYEHKFVFQFDEAASAPLKEEDVHTVVNTPASLLGLLVDNLKSIYPVINLYNTAIHKMWPTDNSNPLFIKVKVKDLLFDGLPMYCNQTTELKNIDTAILCDSFRILHPKTTTLDEFGKDIHSFSFFKHKHNKTDGIYKIDLGTHDVTRIGQILSLNGKNSLSEWKGDTCNRLQGTDTTVFRPYLEEDNIESLYIYHTDVCRSIKLTYSNQTEYKGVKGRRYVVDGSFLESASVDPENHCFCPQSVRGIAHYSACLKRGLLELSGCQGAPVMVSKPHFYMADDWYQGKVSGLSPEKEKHEIYLDLEPYTGYPLRAASRAQINTYLKRIPEVEVMRNLRNVLLPIIWVEEKMELTDELIDLINSQLFNVLRIVDIGIWVLLGLGAAVTVGSTLFYFFKVRPEKGGKLA